MSKNVTLMGANYSNVPSVELPQTGGGKATFTDVSDTTATASTVRTGSYFYTSSGVRTAGELSSGSVNTPTASKGTVSNHSVSVTPSVSYTAGVISSGSRNGTAVSVSASELVSGNLPITANGTNIDVTDYATVTVNVSGTGGIGTLLATSSLGTISTSSTQASDTGKTVSVSDVNSYDCLLVETSVNTITNNRHTATCAWIWLTASSTATTKNGATIATAKWNSKNSSNGTTTTRANTTSYGIYPNSCSISSGTASIAMYQRYNSTQTGTINGTYTTRVYGINLRNLIGG